ncbi:MAG: response regulator transcription factor [Deltaproteobacteria bacterium]
MKPTHVLVVEPDKEVALALASSLRSLGFETTTAHTGKAALRVTHSLRPDLITLEVDLPDVPGTDVCRALHAAPETRNTPIVVITNRTDEIDRIVHFELGVDDYVSKPFSLREVTLRVRACLRRGANSHVARERVLLGDLELELDAHRVHVNGREVMLTPTESQLLRELCAMPNRVFARGELHQRVWGKRLAEGSRVIDAQVKRLRHKLGTAGATIQTVRGVGYRFVDRAERGAPTR